MRDVALAYIKRVKHMAQENMDEVDEMESDENLDEELDDDTQSESGDDHTESETSEDEQDQSTDDESDDSSDQSETGDDDESDTEKRTPEQIAKFERNRRKKTEREFREYKRTHPDAGDEARTDRDTGTKLPPGGIADRFWKTVVKADIAEIAESDPTVRDRAGLIKDIIFKEMPELQKREDGVKIANEIAKGRTVKVTAGTDEQTSINRKTTPTKPRKSAGSDDDFKPLPQDKVNNLSEEQMRAYEAKLDVYYTKHPEARKRQ